MQRKIITQTPGCVVYKGTKDDEVLYSFTDSYRCPETGGIISIPGKGALSNQISSFLFTKLQQLGIPSHFIRLLNMRESLMSRLAPLPFYAKIYCYPCPQMAELLGLAPDQPFERPVIEYRHQESQTVLGESHLLSLDWVDGDELDNIQGLIMRVVDLLRGMMIAFGLNLHHFRLDFGESFISQDFHMPCLAGNFSPENFSVRDLETGNFLGSSYIVKTFETPQIHYQRLALRMGLPLAGPQFSTILPFVSRKDLALRGES